MSIISRIARLFSRKETKVVALPTWTKPFYVHGGHRIFQLDDQGAISEIPFDSNQLQHRGNNRYCIRMVKGHSYTTALNKENAGKQFKKQGLSLLKHAFTN
ncbi:hypothetical protein BWI96_16735 [Siphonobacter sp. SORGH_AS_0500]|uniref:hypothetical protein n=1 Tax=Siphonobacter sp. SORGH_AS_0500 TaxID=1864824 RepID=UPI000CB7F0C1|nr:hypothetical protein [Siphonobacter sp. SORGH_AS_0500]PKK35545.1 hypothetical protein BWI96_16735 [Siphonobacter sp. SORGH_AS_0500]